jgi:hypothetical protein
MGGILLPLWSLVVDGLLGKLNEGGYYAIGYADDIAILMENFHKSQRCCRQP